MSKTPKFCHAFTLVELAIVLVIIGLIVGGVLVGRDLIATATVNAQISQIRSFDSAARTFQSKYGALPGDIPAAKVVEFGFTAVPVRTGTAGRGDGNGLVEGYCFAACGPPGPHANAISSEASWFWEDLSTNTKLIPGKYNFAADAPLDSTTITGNPGLIMPKAKIGSNNFVLVYTMAGFNYYALQIPNSIDDNGAVGNGATNAQPGMTVAQAYGIDSKIDDGLPQSGTVIAKFQNWPVALTQNQSSVWVAGGGNVGANSGTPSWGPTTAATPGSDTTCYDNNNTTGPQKYSMARNSGDGINCALSFRFQ